MDQEQHSMVELLIYLLINQITQQYYKTTNNSITKLSLLN